MKSNKKYFGLVFTVWVCLLFLIGPTFFNEIITKPKDISNNNVISIASVGKETMFLDITPPSEATKPSFVDYSWEKLEKDYVLYLLNKNNWNVTRAASDAGINRSTFGSRMRKLGIFR